MNACSICHNEVNLDMEVKDHFLSKEIFTIYKCPNCHNKFTFPIPNNILSYYKSETYISHNSYKNNAKTLIYKLIRDIMLSYKYKRLFKYFHNKSILDYGCGNGHFLQYLLNMKEDAWGFDNSKMAINNSDIKIKDRIIDTQQTVFSSTYDTITFWHVLEHIDFPLHFIKKISESLKDNGHLIIAVPNYNSYDAKIYKNNWAGYDVPRHITHFSITGLIYLLENHNFLFINKIPLIFDAFYVSLLSEQYKKANFSWIKAIKNGIMSNLQALNTKEYSSNIFIFKKNE